MVHQISFLSALFGHWWLSHGQTNKSSLISFLIQTKWRINYLIFECDGQKPPRGSLQWIFIKWMLMWANLVTLDFYDATPVVNTVKTTTCARYKWVCGWPTALQKSLWIWHILLNQSFSRKHCNYSHCHYCHKPTSSAHTNSKWLVSLPSWTKLA